MAADDLIESGRAARRRSVAGHRRAVAIAGGLVAAAAAGGVASTLLFTPSPRAGTVLVCNEPLPGRALNVNLSWSAGADDVTISFGDGRRASLDPDVADNQRLADMIRHRYDVAGRYEVMLTARSDGSVAQSQCLFVAAD